MRFDPEGHLLIGPDEFYDRLLRDPIRLIRDVLVTGTPLAFPTYMGYCEFLHDVSSRLAVSPKQIVFRGSGHLGFSITPKPAKAWYGMRNGARPGEKPSDLDLAIVDAPYFDRIDAEIAEWESRNPIQTVVQGGRDWEKYVWRRRDRAFYCCRDDNFPRVVGVHHRRALAQAPVRRCCDVDRALSAHIYRDWYAVENRYEYHLRELRERVERHEILQPGSTPLV